MWPFNRNKNTTTSSTKPEDASLKRIADVTGKDTTTLYEIEYERTKRVIDYEVTERLVWSGGAEETITYHDDRHVADQYEYYDMDGDLVLNCNELPAFTERLGVEEHEREVTSTRKAWVDSRDLQGVDYTGESKTVLE